MILVFLHSVIHIHVIISVSDCWTQVKKGEETFHQTISSLAQLGRTLPRFIVLQKLDLIYTGLVFVLQVMVK